MRTLGAPHANVNSGFLKWAAKNGVRTDLVDHTLISRGARLDGANVIPVRGIVASQSIERGERIAVIPAQCVLTGQTAWPIVQRVYGGGLGAVRRALDRVDERLAGENAMNDNLAHDEHMRLDRSAMLATRDALLLTLAVQALQYDRRLRSHPLHEWVTSFPQRIPPMASIAHTQLSEKHDPSKVKPQRRLRAGTRAVDLLPDGSNRETAATELLIVQAGDHGLEDVSTPHTEVALTESILTSFYSGQTSPLTPRQQESASTQSIEDTFLMKSLLQMDTKLRQEILAPLAAGLVDCQNDVRGIPQRTETNNTFRFDEDSMETFSPSSSLSKPNQQVPITPNALQVLDELQWSHFAVRSRSINLRGGLKVALSQQPQLALVPLLDMLNHHPTKENVVYRIDASERDAGKSVVLTSSRRIERGEELLLNYGSYNQRGCLFGDVPARLRSAHASSLNETIRKQEREMRYDIVDDSDDDLRDALRASELERESAPSPSRGPEKRANQLSRATAASIKDANWLWRFGFIKNTSEKEQEAEGLWKKALVKRVSRLTDVHRRGERGGYVVSVPEGLHGLHEQRERLQRQRYGGASVFPPQKE